MSADTQTNTKTAQQTVKEALATGGDVTPETAQQIHENLPKHLQPLFVAAMSRMSTPQSRRVVALTYVDYMRG